MTARPGRGTTAFAAAKADPRSLAESLARNGPRGIHVRRLIVDGAADERGTRARMADKPADFFREPEDIAESAFFIKARGVGLGENRRRLRARLP